MLNRDILLIIFAIFCIVVGLLRENRGSKGKKKTWKEWYYNEYLCSEHWRKRRNRSLVLANFRCKECGYNRNLQVHHLNYKNLWHEKDEDLEVLCRSCHKHIHKIK